MVFPSSRTRNEYLTARFEQYSLLAALLVGFMLLCVGSSCTSPSEKALDQYTTGEAQYGIYCASCHETDTGIGPRLTAKVLATRVSARSLYEYNRRNMPYEAGNSLSIETYWAITAYLLKRHEFMEKTVVLQDSNADTLSLSFPMSY